jgi:exosortase/archaeosortase family protein
MNGAPLFGFALAGPPARRFLIRFAVLAVVLLAIYYFPYADRSLVSRFLDRYLHAYAVVSGAVLRIFEPDVRVVHTQIIGRYSLRLIKTCDAMDVSTLFVSAIVAWPSGWRRRLVAAAAGVALLFVFNVARICSLYFVGMRSPSWFELVHLELWPIVLLIVAVGAFVAATRWMAARDDHHAAA